MADRNSTRVRRVPKEPKTERFMTITLYPESHPRFPWLRMRGHWLADAGFTERTRVRVQVSPGCLIITPDDA